VGAGAPRLVVLSSSSPFHRHHRVGVRTIKWSLFAKSGVEDKVTSPVLLILPARFNEWETFTPAAGRRNDRYPGKADLHTADDIPFKTKME